MTLDLAPGATLLLDGQLYTVEEHSEFHDLDIRLDLVRIGGATPAHERWLLAVLPEPYLILMQRFSQDWLALPAFGIVHEGETFINIYRGTGYRLRHGRTSRSKDSRVDYAIFRANSGRVIFTIGQNEDFDAWIGNTLPAEAVQMPV